MAKNKGKSLRRIKNWQNRFEAGEEVEGTAARRQKLSTRAVKLGEGSFGGGGAEALADLHSCEGMITGVFQRGVFVRVAGEGEEKFCGIAKTFRAPGGPEGAGNTTALAVGDDVTIVLAGIQHTDGQTQLDGNRVDGMVLSRRRRRTLLARPQPRSGKRRDAHQQRTFQKVIAANMDVLLVVVSTVQPPMRRGLIERFLIIAERGELSPILAVNKIDLAPPDEKALSDVAGRGIAVLRCSAQTAEGLAELAGALAGKRSILAGASGVGKSSLLNALIPGAGAATRTVGRKDSRGRHTTSQARVYDLDGGGMIVDTPGVRELGVGITAEQLPWYFPEFEPFAGQCKFRNCTHTHEPHCAVRAAVESESIQKNQKIPARRYESYLRILKTLQEDSS